MKKSKEIRETHGIGYLNRWFGLYIKLRAVKSKNSKQVSFEEFLTNLHM